MCKKKVYLREKRELIMRTGRTCQILQHLDPHAVLDISSSLCSSRCFRLESTNPCRKYWIIRIIAFSPLNSRIWSRVLNPCLCKEPMSPTHAPALSPVLCVPHLLRAQDSPSLEPSQGLYFCPSCAHGGQWWRSLLWEESQGFEAFTFYSGTGTELWFLSSSFRMSRIEMPHARKDSARSQQDFCSLVN